MNVRIMFFALIIMLYPARFMRRMRDSLLYPNGMANRTLGYIVEIACFIIIQGLMLMWHLELPEYFSRKDVVPTCYMYVMLNVVAQILIYKKEDCETLNSHYDYFKWIWMAGVALYSGVFTVALWNQENAFAWLFGAGILHALYNLGYFFFLYFTEKEIMQTRFRPEDVKYDMIQNVKMDMASNMTSDMMPYARPDMQPRLNPNAVSHTMPERDLSPLHRMYGEEYRKLRLDEVRIRNEVALMMFCMMESAFMVLALFMLWEGDVPVVAQMTALCICLFLAGMGYLVYCWVKAEKQVKSMKIETVYEGIARVAAHHPLTVQYLTPDGNTVMRQFSLKDENAFPKGSFVKIMVRDGVVEKIVKENSAFDEDVFILGVPMKKGQKLDKEMVKALKVFLIIEAIGVVGLMCFLYDILI